jgi:hypothetical protein
MTEIGLVTIAERPTRLLLGGISFAAAGAVPSAAVSLVTVGAALWAILAFLATVQLVVNVRRRLRGRPRHGADIDEGDQPAPTGAGEDHPHGDDAERPAAPGASEAPDEEQSRRR